MVFAQIFAVQTFAQKSKAKVPAKTAQTKTTAANMPKVTQIDEIALKNLLKREGENAKPLLINFWATWCDPCREEFPELVQIDEDYKGKIDFITISLDDLAEIKRDVPKFLIDMKAKMPAYLLKTDNEEAAIASVTKDWQGGLPFTVLFNEKGEIAYVRQGKIKTETMRSEIEKVINFQDQSSEFIRGMSDAEKDVISGEIRYKINTLHNRKISLENYSVKLDSNRCINSDYFRGYNFFVEKKITQKSGRKILQDFLEIVKSRNLINYSPKVVSLEIAVK